MSNEFPKKWKDTIDPFQLKLNNIKITEILGYPYAANQVFILKGIVNNKESKYVLKYSGHVDANIKNEVDTLSQLKLPFLPKVIEYDSDYSFRITEYLDGERLSTILGDNLNMQSLKYMYEFGKMLAIIHKESGNFLEAPKRRFHNIPDEEYFNDLKLHNVYEYLINNKPNTVNKCFIHGDFHYANILWNEYKISAILDFELSGIGNKEFDIAWSLILRPEQKFMKTQTELDEFLHGYYSENKCNKEFIKYYMILIYSHFISLGNDKYKEYVRNWLNSEIQ